MANSISTATSVASNPHTHSPSLDFPPLIAGLVQHELVSPSVQVRILSIVDETGTATVGDIVDALPDHPDPVGAIAVMIRLGILVAEVRGVLDANTVLRRADLDPDPVTTGGKPPAADSPAQPAIAAIASDGRGAAGLWSASTSLRSRHLLSLGPAASDGSSSGWANCIARESTV